ncbi:hypothetical protein RO3G_03470 [Rhizopus delemar RA 99-880]|uniref:Uncharacterized protein n=1 Tax=Rhizopus delemar (strain RA 99-880 / ATCC MYA-4621 / FGSC 9543 / NRRL 43880) TaxID=246409 RepID=I1BRD5_RHIO9|nr:hypothetical protein RO3G_03470 [Rhizopus delemar RA 99-880]|eukprot:EIE78765.1 hypothetical protein RO3G_03470 [Rhizopus delemar RA 99-880]
MGFPIKIYLCKIYSYNQSNLFYFTISHSYTKDVTYMLKNFTKTKDTDHYADQDIQFVKLFTNE